MFSIFLKKKPKIPNKTNNLNLAPKEPSKPVPRNRHSKLGPRTVAASLCWGHSVDCTIKLVHLSTQLRAAYLHKGLSVRLLFYPLSIEGDSTQLKSYMILHG